MQDLKSMGESPEVKLGNREVAFIVGALFVVLVVVFGLGVMVGKRLYGQLPVDTAMNQAMQKKPGAAPSNKPDDANKPADVTQPALTSPQPASTGESYTFYNIKKDDPASPETPDAQEKPKTVADSGTENPPAPKEIKKTPPKPEEPAWNWSIQCASLVSKSNADNYVKKLKGKGLDAWMFSFTSKKSGKKYHVVRVGHYKTREKAKEQLEGLKLGGVIPKDALLIER